ncbi:heterokaryon incompatibility protein-domain-containing protein [Phaeosphaeriaceae sp. PMI808]|nr:heterokaryon incompatibility protein-domain-containing protein [Phaeosphaeriaceae sp. PMI808]
MVYFTRFRQNVFNIKSLPFQLDKWLFALPKGWKISFGLWTKYTVDSPGQPPSSFLGDRKMMYSPLKEGQIRLLELHPGKPDEILTASMTTVDLLQAPPFEALSYAWGGYNEHAAVKVNGKPLKINLGLFNALHTLRSQDSPRIIWADALCINQCDCSEKSDQISIMGKTYETAENVAIYLGKPNERSEEGMRCLKFFVDSSRSLGDPPWLHSDFPQVEESLTDILARTWFQRIWTVQEATLARNTTLVCGGHQVSWRCDLQTMRSIIFRIKASAISPYFSSPSASTQTSTLNWSPLLEILETQMRQAARREGVTLRRNHLDVAFDFRHKKAMEPRDKYFAIFGIIENDQGGQLTLAPNYDIPLEELHARFTAEIWRISEEENAPRSLKGENL